MSDPAARKTGLGVGAEVVAILRPGDFLCGLPPGLHFCSCAVADADEPAGNLRL